MLNFRGATPSSQEESTSSSERRRLETVASSPTGKGRSVTGNTYLSVLGLTHLAPRGMKAFVMKTKEHLLDGVPELLLLRLLAHEEMYGYQLVAEIQRRSQGVFEFGEGCIYPLLHRLVQQRMLIERAQKVEGRTRRYYRLASAGKRRLATLEATWQRVSETVAACGLEGAYV